MTFEEQALQLFRSGGIPLPACYAHIDKWRVSFVWQDQGIAADIIRGEVVAEKVIDLQIDGWFYLPITEKMLRSGKVVYYLRRMLNGFTHETGDREDSGGAAAEGR